jgi:hypothetical protein
MPAPAPSPVAISVDINSMMIVGGLPYNVAQGGVLSLYSSGGALTVVDIPADGSYQITISAWGDLIPGSFPIAEIQIDGVSVGDVTVLSTTAADYSLNTTLTAVSHTLAVVFTNDAYIDPTQDLNLYIQSIEILGPN